MVEIHDRFAIRAVQAVSPRNLVWKLTNRSKPAECDIKKRVFWGQANELYWRWQVLEQESTMEAAKVWSQ